MLEEPQANNRRIAINTLVLYVRMLIMMFIGLYTSRVILNALGVSDLGLMNVAASVITMFTFLNGTLSSGTQRFISFGLGEGNIVKLKHTFSSTMTLHLLLSVGILILGETLGLWYVYHKLNIEPGRFDAAMWCYQLSIVSTVVSIIQVPFNSALIAHEKMGVYAYMSIFDAVGKLAAAYLIVIVPVDRVIFYSTLTFLIVLIQTYLYNRYCRKHFEECSFRFGYNKVVFKEMLSFSGWNIIGCLAAVGQGTGVNLVINSFCGTAVNGSRGIAIQANSWVNRFVESFLTAINPQITKSYAKCDFKRTGSLVCNGAAFGSYLVLFLGIPLFIEIEFILDFWLGQIPEHTVFFLRIMLIEAIFRTMGTPTITAMHATGKMKAVNLTVAVILLMIVPISILLFYMGCTPEQVVAANVIPWVLVPPIRVAWVNKYCEGNFPIKRYLTQVYLKTIVLCIVMFILPYLTHVHLENADAFYRFSAVCLISFIVSSITIYYVGLHKSMRTKLNEAIKIKLHIL